MDKEHIEFFRTLLNEQLNVLLDQADGTVNYLINDDANLPDPLDRASFESNRSTLLRIRDRESRLIPKIQGALKRLDEETFGICDECGHPIGIRRLMARPVATLCIKCKTEMEAREKLYG